MKAKVFLVFLLLIGVMFQSVSDNRNKTTLDRNQPQMDGSNSRSFIPYNVAPQSVVFITPQLAGGFTTDSVVVGPEVFTGVSGFYDFKTNGETNVYIQVDPLNPMNIHVIDVQTDTNDVYPAANTRKTKYTFSSNGGVTWEQSVDVPDGIRSGFGVLHLRNSAAVIADHNQPAGGRLDARLYVDAAPLAATFNEFASPNPNSTPFGVWPQISVYNNGNVGLISRRNVSSTAPPETLYYSVFDGTNLSARTPLWISGMNFNGTVGSNARYHIANNGQGKVTVIIAPVNENDTLDNSKMFMRNSTDNGVTWGPVGTIFAPYTVNGGMDTVSTAGGSFLMYKPNTPNFYLAYPVTTDGLFADGKLQLTKSDGVTTTNVTICTAADVEATTTYSQSLAFVFNIDFPALGWSADGSTLYCVYSVVKSDTSNGGFNQRDLYIQYSLTDGNTWSSPVRLTNTPTIDETYPSVSLWNPGSTGGNYELNLVYMKDPGVGPSAFNGNGVAAVPPTRNQLIYRKITGTSPIGIGNNQNILKDYHLAQNYPNPFNPTTTIEYNLIKSGLVSLKVYDVIGREVATLVNEVQAAGVRTMEFDATNLPSGIYIYKLTAGDFTSTKKMILVK